MTALDFVCLGFATWRLSSLLTRSQGPWQIFERIRARLDPDGLRTPGSLGELVTCLWCMSVWVATLLWLLPIEVSYVLAASGAAMWLDQLMPEE
jgi:hypothetical protein